MTSRVKHREFVALEAHQLTRYSSQTRNFLLAIDKIETKPGKRLRLQMTRSTFFFLLPTSSSQHLEQHREQVTANQDDGIMAPAKKRTKISQSSPSKEQASESPLLIDFRTGWLAKYALSSSPV
jgi:hypothetical protein